MNYRRSESPAPTVNHLHTCPDCGSTNVDVSRIDASAPDLREGPLTTFCNRCKRRAIGGFGPQREPMTVSK